MRWQHREAKQPEAVANHREELAEAVCPARYAGPSGASMTKPSQSVRHLSFTESAGLGGDLDYRFANGSTPVFDAVRP